MRRILSRRRPACGGARGTTAEAERLKKQHDILLKELNGLMTPKIASKAKALVRGKGELEKEQSTLEHWHKAPWSRPLVSVAMQYGRCSRVGVGPRRSAAEGVSQQRSEQAEPDVSFRRGALMGDFAGQWARFDHDVASNKQKA